MSKSSSSLLVLFFVVFTELIGFGLIIPVLPQLAKNFQLNYYSLGILMAAFSFAQFFAAPILGHFSDKVGRKPVLILSKLGTMLAYVLLAYANSYWLFLVARLFDGFTGGNIAVARAYICDVTTVKDRAKGMAVIGISFGLGFIVGPAIGGLLYQEVHGQWLISLVAAGLSGLALLMTIFFLKETEKKVVVEQRLLIKDFFKLKDPIIIGLCLAYFFYMLIFSGFETTFSMFTDFNFGFSVKQNSFLFMFAGLIGLVVHGGLARKASSNFGVFTVIGLILLGGGFFGMAMSITFVALLVWLAIFSVGISLVNSFMPALVTTYTSSKNRGLVMGVYESIGSLSRILGPMIAYGVVIDFIRLEYLVFGIIAFVLSVFIFKKCVYRKKSMVLS